MSSLILPSLRTTKTSNRFDSYSRCRQGYSISIIIDSMVSSAAHRRPPPPPPLLPVAPPPQLRANLTTNRLPSLTQRYLDIRNLERPREQWDKEDDYHRLPGAASARAGGRGQKSRQGRAIDGQGEEVWVGLPKINTGDRLSAGSMLKAVDSHLYAAARMASEEQRYGQQLTLEDSFLDIRDDDRRSIGSLQVIVRQARSLLNLRTAAQNRKDDMDRSSSVYAPSATETTILPYSTCCIVSICRFFKSPSSSSKRSRKKNQLSPSIVLSPSSSSPPRSPSSRLPTVTRRPSRPKAAPLFISSPTAFRRLSPPVELSFDAPTRFLTLESAIVLRNVDSSSLNGVADGEVGSDTSLHQSMLLGFPMPPNPMPMSIKPVDQSPAFVTMKQVAAGLPVERRSGRIKRGTSNRRNDANRFVEKEAAIDDSEAKRIQYWLDSTTTTMTSDSEMEKERGDKDGESMRVEDRGWTKTKMIQDRRKGIDAITASEWTQFDHHHHQHHQEHYTSAPLGPRSRESESVPSPPSSAAVRSSSLLASPLYEMPPAPPSIRGPSSSTESQPSQLQQQHQHRQHRRFRSNENEGYDGPRAASPFPSSPLSLATDAIDPHQSSASRPKVLTKSRHQLHQRQSQHMRQRTMESFISLASNDSLSSPPSSSDSELATLRSTTASTASDAAAGGGQGSLRRATTRRMGSKSDESTAAERMIQRIGGGGNRLSMASSRFTMSSGADEDLFFWAPPSRPSSAATATAATPRATSLIDQQNTFRRRIGSDGLDGLAAGKERVRLAYRAEEEEEEEHEEEGADEFEIAEVRRGLRKSRPALVSTRSLSGISA